MDVLLDTRGLTDAVSSPSEFETFGQKKNGKP